MVQIDGEWWGLDEDSPEPEPVALSADDLTSYQLRLDTLAQRMAGQNQLNGEPAPLCSRLYYLGWRESDEGRVGVILGLFADATQALHFSRQSPSFLTHEHTGCLVACPTPRLSDQASLRELQDRAIMLASFSPDEPLAIAWPQHRGGRHTASDRALLVIADQGLVARYCGQDLRLTPTERRVLLALASRPSRPLALGEIGSAGWPPDGPSDFGSVRQIIARLRSKFASARARAGPEPLEVPPQVIETSYGRYGEGSSYALALKPYQVASPPE